MESKRKPPNQPKPEKSKSPKQRATKKETPTPSVGLYESLIHSIDGIIWEADANTFEFSFVSQQAERLLGYPLERWTNEPTFWKDHIHPEDQNWAVNYCVSCTKEMIPHEFEYRMIAADGHTIWLRDIVTVIIENDQPSKLHGVMVDITERKKNQALLSESEKRYRAFFEHAGIGVAEADSITGQLLKVNQKYCDIVGYSMEEMKDLTFQQITHPDDLQADQDYMNALLSEQINSFTMEKRYYKKDGSIVWVELTVSPLWKSGEAFRAHIGIVEDITARKQALNHLHQSEERYRSLFNSMDEGVAINEAVFDENGDVVDYIILDVNPAFEKHSPYKIEEALGKRATDLYQMSPEFIRDWWRAHSLRTETAQTEYYHEPSGRWFFITTTLPEDMHFATIFVNITERKQQETLLIQQNETLQSLHEITKELLHGTNTSELLNIISSRAASLAHAHYGGIFLAEGDALILKAATHDFSGAIGNGEPKPGIGVLGKVWASKETFIIEDYDTWEERDPNYQAWNLHSIAGVPIIIEDEIQGVLEVARTGNDERKFTEIEVHALNQLANLASLVMDNARLYSQAQNEIAERKQAQEEIQHQRDFAQQIMNSMGQGLTVTKDGLIEYVNPAFAQMLGYPQEDLIGKNSHSIIDERDHQTLQEARLKRKAGETNSYELRFIHRNGRHVNVEVTATPRWENGVVTGAIAVITDLTERKLAEEYLRNAEIKYRTLTEQIPAIVYMSLPEQHIGVSYISPQIKLLGFTQEEWIADPQLWFRQLHPDDQAGVLKEIDKLIQNPGENQLEYRIRTRDNKTLWFLDQVTDITDKDGNIIFRQGFMLDITERKQIEEETRNREHFLALLNDMTRSIMASGDFKSMTTTLVNDMAKLLNADDCFITQWDEEKEQVFPVASSGGADFSSVVYPKGEKNLTLSVLEAGDIIIADDSLRHIYTSKVTLSQFDSMSVMAIPLIFGKHKIGAAIIGYRKEHAFSTEEIEHARQAGNQIAIALWNAQQEVELQHSLHETQTLADIGLALSETERIGLNNVLQLIVISAQNLIPHVKQAVIHLYDSQNQILVFGAAVGVDVSVSRNKKMRAGEGVAGQVILTGETINIPEVNIDPRFIDLGSEPSYRSLMVAPVLSGNQKLGTISIQSDIPNAFRSNDQKLIGELGTQAAIAIENANLLETIKKALQESDALYADLQNALQTEQAIRSQLVQNERLALMGRLLATVSHELNNPLQAIQNALFLLREEKGISLQGKMDLDIVLNEAERMSTLIERLRSTYRPIHVEDFLPTQINQLIEDVHALISTHLRHNEIAYEFHPDPELPTIPALPNQIRQVFLNLMMNAVEAMPTGGTLTVSTEQQTDSDEILLTFSDIGPGIAPEILGNIFDPFVTDKQKGTGLGLAISYDIVIKHRGRITAENNPDRGATFKVWLPIYNLEIQ